MKRFLIFLLVFWAAAGHAINRDSLMAVWNNKSLHDTVRLGAIDDIVLSYLNTNPDSAMILAQKELELAISGNYKKEQAWAYCRQGEVLRKKENYIEAINAYSMSLKFAKESGRITVIRFDYACLGIIYWSQGVYHKALENFQAALKIYEEMKDKDGQANLYHNIGMIYSKMDKDSIALEYFLKALSLRDPKNKIGLANNNEAIAVFYMDQGDYVKALQFLNKAKKLYEELENKEGLGYYYINIGQIYEEKGDYQNAMTNYFECLKIREKLKRKGEIADISNNIGELYNIQKNFNQAIPWCEKALKLSQEIGSLSSQNNACNCLYKAYKGLGNSAKALVYYEQSMKLDDSINKQETANKLQQMEFQKKLLADSLKQEDEKVKVELAHREQLHRQRIQKVILFSAITVTLVMIFGIWRRLRYTRKAKSEIEEAKGVIEKEKERSENLLLNILPSEVAEEIKQEGHSKARTFSMVTVMFTDFKDFTAVSEKVSAELLVAEIDYCFSAFDNIIQKYGVEKIKTVGDAYMCVGGMPVLTLTHAADVVNAAIEIRDFMVNRKKEQEAKGGISFELRLGVHTGPVVAGIVGVKKYAYDIWGDTVNIAARMEQNSEAGKINISGSTYKLVKDKFSCVYRGKIEAKNKGEVEMYFVENHQTG